MHVGIITYQTGHLKTWQVLRRVLTKGFRATLYAFPFKHRPPGQTTRPRYADRPAQLLDFDVKAFCRRSGIGYVEVDGWSDAHAHALGAPDSPRAPDVFLHCIAKIVPASFIEGRTILNCHPGLLPHNRGVDAFKWSIVNRWPVGITLHIIDAEIDRGTILHRMRIPILETDTLETVWRRAYDFEGDLLANFDHHLHKRSMAWAVGDDYPCSHRMIPAEQDERVEAIFLSGRDEFIRLSTDLSAQPHAADQADAVTGVDRG
jgi:phosphoribosylglycinamide formyltransferase-1